jgi:hypothetical protein
MLYKRFYFSLVFIFILLLSAKSQDRRDIADTIKFSERIPLELILDVKVKETGAIGYAYCFSGKVVSVHKGTFGDSAILITITGEGDNYYKILSSASEDKILRISFIWNADNEKYSTAYVTGFVDSKKTSWKITSIDIP